MSEHLKTTTPVSASLPIVTSTRRPTAVVAEDEPIIRLDVADILAEGGYEVVAEAGDGQTAVDLIREHQPDVVVLDINMPVLDGVSVAEAVRDTGAAVVMVTAFSDAELVRGSINAGAAAYVVKPFSSADLLPAVEVAVARQRQLRSAAGAITKLQDQLATRKAVDRARGRLMTLLGWSEEAAFRAIQKGAMDGRHSMMSVAQGVLDADDDELRAHYGSPAGGVVAIDAAEQAAT